jgi:hypothetical protein
MATRKLNLGDLSRTLLHEADETWPTRIEIVAYFEPTGTQRRGKCRRAEIPGDRFFGRNGHGAPMTAAELIEIINRLRRPVLPVPDERAILRPPPQ